jgi:hypothetical protein
MAVPGEVLACFASGMFVSDEVNVDASFAAASRRLSDLMDGTALVRASHRAWGEGLARVGPAGSVPWLSKLVHVQFRDLAHRGRVAVLTIRWQATGPAGGLFPIMDADLTLAPHGENATLLGLDGVYGPPAGTLGAALDRAVLHRVAAGTARSLLSRIAEAIADPAPDQADRIPHGEALSPPERRERKR